MGEKPNVGKSASKWTYTALTDIGVEYEGKCVPLEHFTEAFKARLKNADDLEKRKNSIMSETNKDLYWNYEIQLKDESTLQNQYRTIKQELGKLNGASGIEENAQRSRGGHEIENDSVESMRWRTNLKEFFTGLCMILLRSEKFGEGVYTQLFTAFSRILFLYPESGNMYRRGIQIGKDMKNEEATEEATVRLEMTNEEPTVRFETLPLFMESNSSDDSTPATSDDLSRNESSNTTPNESSDTDSNESSDTASNESSQTTSTETPQTASNELPQPLLDHGPKVLLVTQVTTYDSFRYNWRPRMDFQQKHITSKVKGKHGIQLLVEIERSLFRKNVFGCICIGTYIIITHLKVNQDYLQELRRGKIENPVKVKYSKPYDYLQKEDRNEIMEFLILVSCVQSNH